MKKVLYLIVLMLCVSSASARTIKKNGALNLLATEKRFFYQHELSAYAMPSYTNLLFEDIDGSTNTAKYTIGGGIDYRYFFHQNFGLSISLQWQPYVSNYDLNKLTFSEYGTDNSDPLYPNEPYEYRTVYSAKETTTTHYLEFPIKFLFTTPSWNRMQFRSAIGYNYGYNIASNTKISGDYETSLYYTDINFSIDEDNSFGIGNYSDIQINNSQEQLRAHHSVMVELGMGIKLSKHIQLNFDLYGTYALNNTKKENKNFYGLNETYGGIMSTDYISNNIHPLAIGVRTGLSIYIGKQREEILPAWKKRKLNSLSENADFLTESEIAERENNKTKEEVDGNANSEQTDEKKTNQEEIEETDNKEQINEVSQSDNIIEEDTINSRNIEDISYVYHLNSTEILFYRNTTELTESSKMQLLEVINELRTNTPKKIAIIGHTCNFGSDASNIRMGEKRAEAVKKFLRENGIKDSITIETISKGSSQSKYPNTTEENRSKNRRVEFDFEY